MGIEALCLHPYSALLYVIYSGWQHTDNIRYHLPKCRFPFPTRFTQSLCSNYSCHDIPTNII